jgi:transcriptional regulator with XRE-family HTH domain
MKPRRASAGEIDLKVGMAIRKRRKLLGITGVDMAAALGITAQQFGKNEMGINRIPAARLHLAAQTLGCEVADFYGDDAPTAAETPPPDVPFSRLPREFTEHFLALSPTGRQAIMQACRAAVSILERKDR